jgi:hypothetical protein
MSTLDLVRCGILPPETAAATLGSLYASLRLAATPRPVIECVQAREWQPSDVARRVMAGVLA